VLASMPSTERACDRAIRVREQRCQVAHIKPRQQRRGRLYGGHLRLENNVERRMLAVWVNEGMHELRARRQGVQWVRRPRHLRTAQ